MASANRRQVSLGETVARLTHSVGKYISRTAHNLQGDEIPERLLELFIEDLFETDGARHALEVFDEIVETSEELSSIEKIKEVRAMLREIDDIEDSIKRGDYDAVNRAAFLAIRVDQTLRALAREIHEKKG